MRSLVVAFLVAASLLVAAPTRAASVRLALATDAVVGDTPLQAGSYRVEISPSGDSVTFSRGKKVVATSACTVTSFPSDVPEDRMTFTKTADGKLRLARILLVDGDREVKLAQAP